MVEQPNRLSRSRFSFFFWRQGHWWFTRSQKSIPIWPDPFHLKMSDQNQQIGDLEAPEKEIEVDFEKVKEKSSAKIDKNRRKELMAKRLWKFAMHWLYIKIFQSELTTLSVLIRACSTNLPCWSKSFSSFVLLVWPFPYRHRFHTVIWLAGGSMQCAELR